MTPDKKNISSRGSILLADDDLLYRSSLSDYLTREHFQVFTAENGNEVLLYLARRSFDLCILDFYLAGISFESIVTVLNRSLHHTPFIIITGDSSCETERIARSYGPAFFFVKPFPLYDFRSVVTEVISSSGNKSSPEFPSEREWEHPFDST